MKTSTDAGRGTRVLRRVLAAATGIASAAAFTVPGAAAPPSESEADTRSGPAEQMGVGNYDYNGDGLDDIVARRNPGGNLEVWPGDGTGGFGQRYIVGGGWEVMDLIETAGDLNGDGFADLIAREASTGSLYFYPGNGTTFDSRSRIGRGWEVMSSIVSGHDFDGDGLVDFIATEAGTGTLWLYPGTGTGTHGARYRIGSSFHQVREMTAVGDMDEDGYADVVAVNIFDECMYFYGGPGSEKFRPRVMFDCGWDVMESPAAVGDFNGDGHVDWVGREDLSGLLYLFHGNGTGSYSASPAIDPGWGTMTIA